MQAPGGEDVATRLLLPHVDDVDAVGQAGRGILAVAEVDLVRDAREEVAPFLATELEARLSALAALRDDLDDAVGGLGAVQRCRRRALDDLHRLDVFRIEVVEPRRVASVADGRAAGGIVVHAHAVHVHDRLVGERQARRAANAHRAARADHAGRRQDEHTCTLLPEQLLHVYGGRRLCFLRDVQLVHGVADGAHLRTTSGSRHDHRVERRHRGTEVEVDGRAFAVAQVHGLVTAPVADPSGANDRRTGGDAEESVVAERVGDGPDGGADDDDLHLRDGPLRARVHHSAAYGRDGAANVSGHRRCGVQRRRCAGHRGEACRHEQCAESGAIRHSVSPDMGR